MAKGRNYAKNPKSTTPEPTIAEPMAGQPPFPAAELDPFSPESLRLTEAFDGAVSVKKVLATVPVRRPSGQDWIRVHRNPDFRQTIAVINMKEDGEFYAVNTRLLPELFGECVGVTVYTAINRQGVTFLWPIRVPGSDGRDMTWWQSARQAAELATENWIRIKADRSLGGYQIFQAVDDLGDPEWPTTDFWGLIRLAFKDHLVDTLEHPIVRKLRGRA